MRIFAAAESLPSSFALSSSERVKTVDVGVSDEFPKYARSSNAGIQVLFKDLASDTAIDSAFDHLIKHLNEVRGEAKGLLASLKGGR